ncbi:hypothetical protein BZL29_6653 [Mycobacterium kansasii]|uniref:Uncharacterized protein n=1 Tax=Mycobacterium kansasii TaxID=1768 RepID=A0A1V3WMC8_MYCKA|nr:hypothetical protein BZL29_6653 [Mycobacterium kansasii]
MPDNTVKLTNEPTADRLMTRAIECLQSSLKICFLKLPSA